MGAKAPSGIVARASRLRAENPPPTGGTRVPRANLCYLRFRERDRGGYSAKMGRHGGHPSSWVSRGAAAPFSIRHHPHSLEGEAPSVPKLKTPLRLVDLRVGENRSTFPPSAHNAAFWLIHAFFGGFTPVL